MKQRVQKAVDVLAWLVLASLLHVILFNGFTLRVGGLKLSAHDALQLGGQLVFVLVVRWWLARSPLRGFLDRSKELAGAFRSIAIRHSVATRLMLGLFLAAIGSLALFNPKEGLTGRYFDNP